MHTHTHTHTCIYILLSIELLSHLASDKRAIEISKRRKLLNSVFFFFYWRGKSATGRGKSIKSITKRFIGTFEIVYSNKAIVHAVSCIR